MKGPASQMSTDDETTIEDLADLLKNYVLHRFEATHADGQQILVEDLYDVVEGVARTDVREAIHTWKENDLLEVGREAGQKVVYYRPLARVKARMHQCYTEADENGNVSPTLIKLFLQEYVVLYSDHRTAVRQSLNDDLRRSIKASTIRRARVNAELADAITTFRVAPDEH